MRNPSSPAISIKSAVSLRIRAISRFSMGPARHRGLIRLYVDQHVGHPIQRLFDSNADLRSELMGFIDAHIRVHFEVQIDVPLQPGLTGKTFLDSARPAYSERDFTDTVHGLGVGHGVDQL